MKRLRKPKFDPAACITNELIAIIERGTLPWRKPWRVGGANQPLRVNGEPYSGVNNFMLTMRTLTCGYMSPYWMTMKQANDLGARVIKGSKSSVVVYYGTTGGSEDDATDAEVHPQKAIPFMKSYRVFNAEQIDGLEDRFFPKPVEEEQCTGSAPIPHMEAFFDAIDIDVVHTGREAYYMQTVDKVYMPELALFETPHKFYAIKAHEFSHATKARHRLNRDYGHARFGNTAYAREELTAELSSVFIGQHLGFAPYTMEMSAAYLDNWLRVLKSDKRAIFKHAADAQKACDYLIAASERGQRGALEAAA